MTIFTYLRNFNTPIIQYNIERWVVQDHRCHMHRIYLLFWSHGQMAIRIWHILWVSYLLIQRVIKSCSILHFSFTYWFKADKNQIIVCIFKPKSYASDDIKRWHIITWLAVHCFPSVHCTQCIVQIQCTRGSCRFRSPPPFLVNTVKRYFVTYAAMKYATFYWNNFIWLPVI